jgi:hypothetical protein
MFAHTRSKFVMGALSALLAASLVTACSKNESKSKAKAKPKQESIAQYEKSALPKNVEALDFDFDGKTQLVGYRVKPERGFKRGQELKITLYWKSVAPIEEGYLLVGHLLDESGESMVNLGGNGPLRKRHKTALTPAMWKAGNYYADEITLTIPKKVKTDTVKLVVGIEKKGTYLPVTKGEKDSQQRVTAVTIDLTKGRTAGGKSQVPQLRLDKLDAAVKINIDGKLDEAAWQEASLIGPFVDPTTGGEAKASPVQGKARMLWNKDGLFLGVEVTDKDVVGGFKKTDKDPQLWTKDTIELMVDPDPSGDNKDYYEIQINS